MNICPCCKQQVETDRIMVCLDTNTITFRGNSVRVRPTGAVIAHVLAHKHPGSANMDSLIRAVWGFADPPESTNTLSVHLSSLRIKLRPLDVVIAGVRGAGWRLVFPPSLSSGSQQDKQVNLNVI